VPTQFSRDHIVFRMCLAKFKVPMTPFQKGDDELEIVARVARVTGPLLFLAL
jgi:hypothetical protein